MSQKCQFQLFKYKEFLLFFSFMLLNEQSWGFGLFIEQRKQFENVTLGFINKVEFFCHILMIFCRLNIKLIHKSQKADNNNLQLQP